MLVRSRLTLWAAPVFTRSFSSLPQIVATPRTVLQSGSRKSRQLRSENIVPGVVYGVDDDRNVLKRMITVEKNLLMKELRDKGRSFENTIYEIVVEDTTGKSSYVVVPRQTAFCPLTGSPLNVNFLRYRPGTHLRIPIDFVNAEESQDIKRGSYVVGVREYLECVCDGAVPKSIVLDLSKAQKGDIYRVSSLELPQRVRPAKNVPLDSVIAVIKSARGSG